MSPPSTLIVDYTNIPECHSGLHPPQRYFRNCIKRYTPDDILVTGTEDNYHIQNLATVFSQLQDQGFRLRKEKCTFLQTSVDYLGHRISAEVLQPRPEKIAAVNNSPQP